MENQEEVMQSLEDFAKTKPKEIPKELEDYLEYVAKTGDPVYQWSIVKSLIHEKLLSVITDFYESCPTCPNNEFPPCPNVEPFNYEEMKASLLEHLDSFAGAPFTIQRLCELLTTPTKEYSRVDKFMRAVEKNILVVSTREPGSTRRTDAQSDLLMNGVMDGRGIDIGEAIETVSSDGVNLLHSEENGVTENSSLRIDELDMENRADVENTNDSTWSKEEGEAVQIEDQTSKTCQENGKLEIKEESDITTKIGDSIEIKERTVEVDKSQSESKEVVESKESEDDGKCAESSPASNADSGTNNDSKTMVPSDKNIPESSSSVVEIPDKSSELTETVEITAASDETGEELVASPPQIGLESEAVTQASTEDDELSNESYSPTQPVESLTPSPPTVVISEITNVEGVEEVETGGVSSVVVAPTDGLGLGTSDVEEVIVATSAIGDTAVSEESAPAKEEAVLVTESVIADSVETEAEPIATELAETDVTETAMVSEVVETEEKVPEVEEMQQQAEEPREESMEVDETLQMQEEMSMDGDEPMDQTEEVGVTPAEVDS